MKPIQGRLLFFFSFSFETEFLIVLADLELSVDEDGREGHTTAEMH